MRYDKEILARIETQARKLARTGEHPDWWSVENTIVDAGYPEARRLFANRWTQVEISRLCQANWKLVAG
jgi:hypothetical protein